MKSLISNKKAYFDFKIGEQLTAGLVLSGPEVKSLKNGQASLSGAYISIRNGQAFLTHMHISPYKYARGSKAPEANPERTRKLLLNKKEINSLIGKEKGVIIVPLEVFQTNKGLIKLKIGVGKSKKKFDKRELIKKREIQKRISRMQD